MFSGNLNFFKHSCIVIRSMEDFCKEFEKESFQEKVEKKIPFLIIASSEEKLVKLENKIQQFITKFNAESGKPVEEQYLPTVSYGTGIDGCLAVHYCEMDISLYKDCKGLIFVFCHPCYECLNEKVQNTPSSKALASMMLLGDLYKESISNN